MKKLTIFLLVLIGLLIPSINVKASYIEEIVDDIEAIEKQDNSYSKTMRITNKCKQIVEQSELLSGKKITVIGDSITEGPGWLEDMAQIAGCDICNLGIGGSAIADYWDENSLILRWNQIPEDSDIIIIFAGINDYFIGNNFGDRGESGTYCGDTWNLFCNIGAAYPSSEKYVVLNYRSESENWEQFGGRAFEPYIEVQKQYADELGLKTIDLFSNGFLDTREANTREALAPDGVHPNEYGDEVLAYKILSEIILQSC